MIIHVWCEACWMEDRVHEYSMDELEADKCPVTSDGKHDISCHDEHGPEDEFGDVREYCMDSDDCFRAEREASKNGKYASRREKVFAEQRAQVEADAKAHGLPF